MTKTVRNKDLRLTSIVSSVYGKWEDEEYYIGLIRYDDRNGLYHAIFKYNDADVHVGLFKNMTLAANAVFDKWMKET